MSEEKNSRQGHVKQWTAYVDTDEDFKLDPGDFGDFKITVTGKYCSSDDLGVLTNAILRAAIDAVDELKCQMRGMGLYAKSVGGREPSRELSK